MGMEVADDEMDGGGARRGGVGGDGVGDGAGACGQGVVCGAEGLGQLQAS